MKGYINEFQDSHQHPRQPDLPGKRCCRLVGKVGEINCVRNRADRKLDTGAEAQVLVFNLQSVIINKDSH